MRSAFLRGRDHAELDAIEAVAEGPGAVALSRGGAPKTYEHTDPNEDAVCFAWSEHAALVAVADAHRGAAASEVALDFVLRGLAPTWLSAGFEPAAETWGEAAFGALEAAHRSVREATEEAAHQGSRTTFALALVRFAAGRLCFVSLGDSHVFRVTAFGAVDLAAGSQPCPPRYFLGSESLTAAEIRERAVADVLPLEAVQAVLVASDGLSELGIGVRDPELAVAGVARAVEGARPGARALELARGVAEQANAAHARQHSGDNIGVAALWLAPDEPPPAA